MQSTGKYFDNSNNRPTYLYSLQVISLVRFWYFSHLKNVILAQNINNILWPEIDPFRIQQWNRITEAVLFSSLNNVEWVISQQEAQIYLLLLFNRCHVVTFIIHLCLFDTWQKLTEEKYEVTSSSPEAAILVQTTTEPKLTLKITLTSPTMREDEDEEEEEEEQEEEEEEEQEEAVENGQDGEEEQEEVQEEVKEEEEEKEKNGQGRNLQTGEHSETETDKFILYWTCIFYCVELRCFCFT